MGGRVQVGGGSFLLSSFECAGPRQDREPGERDGLSPRGSLRAVSLHLLSEVTAGWRPRAQTAWVPITASVTLRCFLTVCASVSLSVKVANRRTYLIRSPGSLGEFTFVKGSEWCLHSQCSRSTC